MNNTAHFAIDNITGKLVALGVGPDTTETANAMADLAESVALSKGVELELTSAVFNISDLYRLKTEIGAALDNLNNDELSAPSVEPEEVVK